MLATEPHAVTRLPSPPLITSCRDRNRHTAIFHRLPSGSFGLKKWYGEAIEKKKGKKADATGNDADNGDSDKEKDE